MRCRELDIFKILRFFGKFLEIFLEDFFRRIFGRNFLGGNFWEEFIGQIRLKRNNTQYINGLLCIFHRLFFASTTFFLGYVTGLPLEVVKFRYLLVCDMGSLKNIRKLLFLSFKNDRNICKT